MLIRSQDKLQLIPMGMGAISVNYRNKKQIFFYTAGDTEGTLIAEYSTEAKAIRVLDMIQDFYIVCKTLEVSNGRLTSQQREVAINKIGAEKDLFVFQMPQESEV